MKILNFFYEQEFKFLANTRKSFIKHSKVLIKGPASCGKKALIFSYLSSFDKSEVLFIDLLDPRFEFQSLNNLKAFLEKNKQIKILCLYNLNFEITLDLNINILLATSCKSLKIQDFDELELDYFDFEEFVSLYKKNLPISSLVSLFIQNGRSNLNLRFFSQLELKILKYLALNLGQQISIAKLFLELKKDMKTSKDSVYSTIKKLEDNYIICYVFHDEKKLYKIYFKDFGLKNKLCIQKDFNHLFENLIFNELHKLKQEFFYNSSFTFYSKALKRAYVSSPALDIDLIKLKANKISLKALELGIFHIIFITLSSEASFFEKGIKIDVVSFDKFALSF